MYVLCVLTSIILIVYLLLSIIGAIILFALAFISYVSHIISMSHIQLNGVRLRETQFSELYKKVVELSRKMELKEIPEVYVIESGGMLNAFATKVFGFFGKNIVVLYSDFVDIAYESDEFDIDFVIAHELAHIKRNHIVKSLFIFPAMWIPFIGTSYLRAAEYTCDRIAAYYTEKPEYAINGLLVLAAGKRLFRKVNLEDYMLQYNEKKGFFATVTELLSTHPPIPKRIHEIEIFYNDKPTVALIKRTKQIVLLILIFFILIPVLLAGVTYGTLKMFEGFSFFGDFLLDVEYTPLMEATINGEEDMVEELLNQGADPNELNEFGDSALIVAIYHERKEMIPLLLEYGADPNLQDDYGWTPLMSAVMVGDLEVGKLLLEAGSDPTLKDSDGLSAIDYAEDLGDIKFLELLGSYKLIKSL